MEKLAGKTVVVVGATSGMGFGVAEDLAQRGANVVIVGRDQGRLQAAKNKLHGDRVRVVRADATRESDVARLFDEVATVDHVVVTAADLRYARVVDLSLDDVHAVIESKLVAAILLAKHAAPRLADDGSLVFVSGVAAERPAPKGALVAAVNGGLNALVRALAIELAPIRVNALSPGWVDTPVWDRIAMPLAGATKDFLFEKMAARLPTRRVGRPEDIAHAIRFLLENNFTTGETLYVDGGQRLV